MGLESNSGPREKDNQEEYEKGNAVGPYHGNTTWNASMQSAWGSRVREEALV